MQDLFLTNYSKIKFLDRIKDSFSKCNAFYLSVSFIKKAGLLLFEKEIEESLKRGVKGKIITSTYQNFTDIESLNTFLRRMEKYPNFEVHLDFSSFGDNGFHSILMKLLLDQAILLVLHYLKISNGIFL